MSWQQFSSADPELFKRLREIGRAEVRVCFSFGMGSQGWVEIPAASFTVHGWLCVEALVDRLVVEVPGWGPEDFAWFGRRRGRGHADYWQGAIEYRPEGAPALVLYFTAPEDGLEICVRQPEGATERDSGENRGSGH